MSGCGLLCIGLLVGVGVAILYVGVAKFLGVWLCLWWMCIVVGGCALMLDI